MSERTIILSDLHLQSVAATRRKVESLRAICEGADRLVLNGDTITWSLFVQPGPRDEAIALLRETLRADGIETILLAGNADDEIADARSLSLADGRVLVFHGHAVFEGLSPWRQRADWLERQRRAALAALPADEADTLDGQLRAVDRTLADLQRPQRPAGAARAWAMRFAPLLRWPALAAWLRACRLQPTLTARFVERYAPPTRFVVVGHTHRPSRRRVGERWILNTGSLEGRFGAQLVEVIDGRILRAVSLCRRGGRWRRGNDVRMWGL